MPGLDGHALLRRLPERGVAASIVVMSGSANMDDVIDALRTGAVDFLQKPWSTSELASALERGIEVFRTLPQTPAVRVGARRDEVRRRRARARRAPTARASELLQGCNRTEPPPMGERTISHLHRVCARSRRRQPCARADRRRNCALARWRSGPGDGGDAPGEQPTLPGPGRDPVPERRRGPCRGPHGPRRRRDAGVARRLPDPVHTPETCAALHEPDLALLGRARALAMQRDRRGDRARGRARRTRPAATLGGLLLDAGAAFLLWTLDESRREPSAFAGDLRSRRRPPRGAVRAITRRSAEAGALALGDARRPGRAGARSPRTPRLRCLARRCGRRRCLARPLVGRLLVDYDDPSSPAQAGGPELLDGAYAYELGVGETVLRRLSVTLADDTRVHWDIYK